MIDLSQLVSASIQVVKMVELFCPGEKLTYKMKYEIARNSMMLTIFTLAYGIEDEKERGNFLGMWARKVSGFASFKSYEDYVEKVEGEEKMLLFEHHLDGLINQFRRDT